MYFWFFYARTLILKCASKGFWFVECWNYPLSSLWLQSRAKLLCSVPPAPVWMFSEIPGANSPPFDHTDPSATGFLATVWSFSSSSSFSSALMTVSLGRCTLPTMLLWEVSFIVHQPFSEMPLPPKTTSRYADMVPKSINAKPLTCWC